MVGKGAPDYTHLRQILARDALGNLVPVACDPSGRIILLPYGTQTVEQDDPTRTIQGIDGITLHTLAVDAQGRLIMLPYGWDGTAYRKLKVDDEGRMIGVMKGQADVKWGLRGWWKFVASEGTTIKDYSGYGNNGSALSGAGAEAKYEDGVIGQCLEFDGADDYIDIPDTTELRIIGDLTLEAWVYITDAVGDNTIISKEYLHEYSFFVNAFGALGFYHGDGASEYNTVAPAGSVGLNDWYHVILVRNTGTTKLYGYVNGILHLSPDYTKTPTAGAHNVEIGRQAVTATRKFTGLMDEVRIYNRALSADEVSWRYANTRPDVGKPTRMIAVDSEGRMEVNIKDLPYKARVLDHADKFIAAGGGTNLYSSYVSEGKVWVLTSVIAYTDTQDCDSIDMGIFDGTNNYILDYIRGVGTCQKLWNQGEFILKAGDRINVGFTGLPVNAVIVMNVNGYELDAP